MTWTLREANLHSPDAVMNRIVRQINQMEDDARLITNDIFPLVELSDSEETHFTMDGLRMGMRRTELASESPVGDIESLGEEDVTVETFKKKIQVEKGVNTELNSQSEILNLFNATSDALMEDVLMTRARIAWRSSIDGSIDGLIGDEGLTAHAKIDSTHVETPATPYSDHANSTPINDFIEAEYRISEDGNRLGQAGGITACVTPSVLKDLKLNNDIQSEYQNVRALSQQQLTDAFQIDQLRVVRTKLPRLNANGEPIDGSGNVVGDPANAAEDNVLEPYDPSAGTTRRNVVVMAPGQVTAFQPWFLDRLAEMGQQAPSGDVSVDGTNGWMTQTWTDNDPLTTWFAAKQEIGFHVQRGDNIFVIQDI